LEFLFQEKPEKNSNQKLKTYNKEQNDMISCLYEMSNSRDKQGISLEST